MNLLGPGRRRESLKTVLAGFVMQYENCILPLARMEAEQAALLLAAARRSGRVLHLADALIAGTARAHDLSLATRNVEDFAGLDVDVTSPWINQ